MRKVTARTYARAGLLGNPSDGYHGKTISFIVGNFFAEVRFTESKRIHIRPAADEVMAFDSLACLHHTIRSGGYYGSERLIKAALAKLYAYAGHRLDPTAGNFKVSLRTNIPRQVGMAGSSAIIMSTLRTALQWYGVTLEPALLASLTLAAETEELKIPAGLQDRVIQAFEGLVYMDFDLARQRELNGLKIGHYEPLELSGVDHLYVAYSLRGAEPTEVTHSNLRERYQAGETRVIDAMREFADLAELGRAAWSAHNWSELARLINANFDLRRSICSLHPHHVEMVEVARRAGASAKFCGSGGAIVGTCPSPRQYRQLKMALESLGCRVIRPRVGHFQAPAADQPIQ